MAKVRQSFHEAWLRDDQPTLDDLENAEWLLENLTHYFCRRSNYGQDIQQIARALKTARTEGAAE